MPIDSSRLWAQVALGEDAELELKAVEFRGAKVSAPRRGPLADELAAFGNASGGRLVLGVTDDRQPQGLDATQLDALANLVTEFCTDTVKPSLDFRLFRVPVPAPASGGALVVEVPEGVAVYRSPGGYFRRRGDTKCQMDSAAIRRLTQVRGQSDAPSTDTQIVRGTAIKDLQQENWRQYVSSRIDDAPEVALTKLKFAKADSQRVVRATVGGVLLSAQDPRQWLPNAWVQAVCYRGDRPDSKWQL
ncbi:MAG: ATP-binding protein, partial [Gammaproteobacteria bacterium]|nr:ATP-binding protein [Gammaproteobacteria bacterium]